MKENQNVHSSLLNAIVDTVVDGIITINQHGIIDTFNPAAERLFGYTQSEVIGKNIKMLMPAPYQENHDNYLANYAKTGNAKVIGIGRQVSGLRKDGSQFPIELSVSEMWVEDKRMYTGIVRDVSSTVEKQLQLEDQVARLDAVIETVLDGVITIDSKGTVETFNPAAEQIFGYKSEEVVGHNVKMLMPEPYRQEHDGYLQNYFSTNEAKVIGIGREVVGKRKDKSIFPLHLSISKMLIKGEIKFTGIVRDISVQKKHELTLLTYHQDLEQQVKERTAQFRKAKVEAEMANRSKSKFLSRMSHELRTPLNAILGFTQIEIALSDPDRDIENIEEIQKAGNHLLAMINEIMDLGEFNSEGLNITMSEVLLNKVINQTISLLKKDIEHKAITIVYQNINDFIVHADEVKLVQALTNLLDNAIKYSEPGQKIEIQVSYQDGLVAISVIDNGIGIAPEYHKSVFEPFEKVGDEYSGDKGAGIGLTIVKEFVEAMEGSVELSSALGKGSTFSIKLKLARKAVNDDVFRVLYIEDNSANRNLMKQVFKRISNAQYDEAFDGKSGISLAKKMVPHLILLDINLPDLTGYQVLEQLKQDPTLSNTVFVGISANAMPVDIAKADKSDLNEYIAKPFQISEIIELVERLRNELNEN